MGVGVRNKYGWQCEYSTFGMPPKQRNAVQELLDHNRKDLLLRLLESSNTVARVYAAEALLYLDHCSKLSFEEYKACEAKKLSSIDSLDLDYDTKQGWISYYKTQRNYFESNILTASEIDDITKFRKSEELVTTCLDGSGSYQTSLRPVSDILSDAYVANPAARFERFFER